MMHRFAPAALLAFSLSACTFINLDDLEKDDPSSCDAAHPCVTGYHCGATGKCAVDQVCGPAVSCPLTEGVCAGSTELCAAGLVTACDATSYGPDYETVETKCDGKDNDCDGTTDVGLMQACATQAGVCAGSHVACASGSYPACTGALFAANNGAYEAFETKCDGLDNDCDGKVDSWAPLNVSNTGGVLSRNATAALGNSGIVVLWGEGQTGTNKIASRIVHSDNSMTATGAPAITIGVTVSSKLPAIAVDASTMVAAWAEEVNSAYRIVLVTLDESTALSTLTGGGALPVFSGRAPTEIAVAVDASAGKILLIEVDGQTAAIAQYPANLAVSPPPAADYTRESFFTGGQHVQVSPAGLGFFWVSWEDVSSMMVMRCLVDGSGNQDCAPRVQLGILPQTFPLTAGSPWFGAWLFEKDSGGGTYALMSATCDGGNCSVSVAVPDIPGRSQIDVLRVAATARNVAPTFVAWDEGMASVHYAVIGRNDGGVQPGDTSAGRRPTPVFLSTGAPKGLSGAIIFDSEGTTAGGISADEIYLARYCL